jgi:hypothetical protein
MAQVVIDSAIDDYENALALVHALFGKTAEPAPAVVAEQPARPARKTPAKAAPKPKSTATVGVLVTEGDKVSDAEKPGGPIEGFTPARMKRYVQNLSEIGQAILRYMAQHAPQVELAEIQKHFDRTPREWAGTMTTFGRAARVSKGVDRMPFERDRKHYTIDERVAKMALDALDQLGL